MAVIIIGLACPYDERSVGFLPRRGGNLAEQLERFAISPAALDATDTKLMVNHDRTQAVRGARLTFFSSRVGLHFSASAPDSPAWQTLLAAEASWRGVSIAYPDEYDSSAQCHVNWQTCCRHMTRIDCLSEISVVVGDERPGYAATWATTNQAEAVARIRQEIHVARRNALGPNYRQIMPKDELPRQATNVEALLRARDPHRELIDVPGWW